MAKMTRAEAVEMLKNRKVYVNGKSAEIQKKLFELGFKWNRGNQNVANEMSPFLFISDDMFIGCASSMIFFKKHKTVEISAEEILSIEIAESLKENDVVVSGWEGNISSAKWVAVVKSGMTYDYDAKVIFLLESACGQKGALRFDEMCETQEWTRSATEEEKQKLIDRLKHKDCDDARQILKEVFGIEEKPECPFKPFDKVMVRNENSQIWTITFFDKYKSGVEFPYYTLNGIFKQCIPYENNEHLKDTTNSQEE